MKWSWRRILSAGVFPLALLTQTGLAAAQTPTRAVGSRERHLIIIRGTVGGDGTIVAGRGFTVTQGTTVYCGSNPFPTYRVTFAPHTFLSAPSVVVSAQDFTFVDPNLPHPTDTSENLPVYTAAIDGSTNLGESQGGGITKDGFTVRIKTDAFGSTCYGSYNWDFIAVGQH